MALVGAGSLASLLAPSVARRPVDTAAVCRPVASPVVCALICSSSRLRVTEASSPASPLLVASCSPTPPPFSGSVPSSSSSSSSATILSTTGPSESLGQWLDTKKLQCTIECSSVSSRTTSQLSKPADCTIFAGPTHWWTNFVMPLPFGGLSTHTKSPASKCASCRTRWL
ncbi:hypothetical protein PF002_g33213 [Phytophthora fragariae]|uniref:Secreted protein n=2 Tax=Phytophthora fragariae TaxID=53985 RepID=A0A6A3D586_9STRA|nr:hypothetical protein PF009_g33045 [Phytophthora fragariae]KAE9158032.1 hypothetical protein PF002_g33213 [Phytophthora fragariae]